MFRGHHDSIIKRLITVRLLKPGPPRQWKPIRRQNWNNSFPTFSNPANQMPSTKQWNLNLFVDPWCLCHDVKLKTVVLSCAYGFRNNYMLHSVYFRSLVDLENKSCVREPFVNIYRQSAYEVKINWCLFERPFKA